MQKEKGIMNAKKFTILSIVTVLLFGIFLGCASYYNQSLLAIQREQAIKDIADRNEAYDQETSDKVEDENNMIPEDNQTEKKFNNFFEIFNNALTSMQNATSYKTEVVDGYVDSYVDAHIIGYENVHLPTNMYVKQVRDGRGRKLFRYFQYGETVDALKGIYENAQYTQCVYQGGTYYVYKTKDGNEMNQDLSGKYTTYTRNAYLDEFSADADEFYYDINSKTVKKVVYFSKPTTPKGNYVAKVQLTDDAARRYNQLICSAALFESCKAYNISLTFTFNYKGEFIKMEVNENMDLVFKLKVANLVDTITDIKTTNNYVMNFDFNFDEYITIPVI